ncbi:transmembrane protein 68-like [Sceloporus undulatus]|uniref:transmembrane protein 68-like n=1 Tax=Sceloporus undulatus TaxID=8520 RepID=UPI001C4B9143|nr:transmembrane protein 68-like [Sceloporus undulatus]
MKNWNGCTYLHEYLSSVVCLCFVLLFGLLFFALLFYFVYCFMSFYLYLYKKIYNMPEDMQNNLWDNPRHVVSYILCQIGRIFHDYEVIGMENVPKGPGIIVFYHGAFGNDYGFFISNLYSKTGRLCHSVTDNIMYLLPGLRPLLNVLCLTRGRKAECLEILKAGHLLGISPGGMREALFSDHHYELIWGNRTGFAQLALEAKVPIIPLFTQNIRESCRTVGRTRLSRWLYERTRITCLPVLGYFPVKLRTYIGEPIPYDPNITAQELAEKTKIAIENLRDRYQKIPGSILTALAERFQNHHKEN